MALRTGLLTLLCTLLVVGCRSSEDPEGSSLADSLMSASPWSRMEGITPKVYPVLFTGEPPMIDGLLHDAVWSAAGMSGAFVDIEGSEDRKPLQGTHFQAAWDDRALYVAVRLEESDLWGTLTEKNAVLFWENDIEIFLDPDGDMHRYHEIEWNVLGTIWELSLNRPYRDGGAAQDPNNLPGLEWAVHADGTINTPGDVDTGWTVEIALPWSALAGFDPDLDAPVDGSAWRVNFSRVQWPLVVDSSGTYAKDPSRREHNQVWSPIGIIDMHRPERWGWFMFTASGNVAESLQAVQTAQDRLMAVYYFAVQFRAHTGAWPLAADFPRILAGLTFEPSDAGWQASDGNWTIDHLGHLTRHAD